MLRHILRLLALTCLLSVLVAVVFKAVYRDYLLVRDYHQGLRAGRLEPKDIDSAAVEGVYERIPQRIPPGDVELAGMLEDSLWAVGRKEQALDLARRLVEAQPYSAGLRQKYADRLSEMEFSEQAEEEYHRALSLLNHGNDRNAEP